MRKKQEFLYIPSKQGLIGHGGFRQKYQMTKKQIKEIKEEREIYQQKYRYFVDLNQRTTFAMK